MNVFCYSFCIYIDIINKENEEQCLIKLIPDDMNILRMEH